MGLLSWLGLAPDQDLLAAGLAADAQNADLSRQFKERGVMTKADYTMAMDHYEASYNQLAEDGAVIGDNLINDHGPLQPLDHTRLKRRATDIGPLAARAAIANRENADTR